MLILGIDLGNKSRNSISIMDEKLDLLDYSTLLYDGSISVWQHRKNICAQIQQYIDKYHLTKDDYIIFEKINLFMRNKVSRLVNITSLAFLQATIINEFSEKISISQVPVQSWKTLVLGSRSSTKEDSVKYVEEHYPQVDLNVVIHHPRKGDEIKKDDDTADSICISVYGHLINKKKLDENLVNYT